jgi:hypothetical protein
MDSARGGAQVFGPTIKNLLDLHADVRRRVDGGEYVVEVEAVLQLSDDLAMQGLHSRVIEMGPAKTAAQTAG